MKLLLFIFIGLPILTITNALQKQAEVEDTEFAKFKELDEDDVKKKGAEGADAAVAEFNEVREEKTNEQASQEESAFQTGDNIEDEEFHEDEFENLKGVMKDEGLKIKEDKRRRLVNLDGEAEPEQRDQATSSNVYYINIQVPVHLTVIMDANPKPREQAADQGTILQGRQRHWQERTVAFLSWLTRHYKLLVAIATLLYSLWERYNTM